jgi:hypothetical protein
MIAKAETVPQGREQFTQIKRPARGALFVSDANETIPKVLCISRVLGSQNALAVTESMLMALGRGTVEIKVEQPDVVKEAHGFTGVRRVTKPLWARKPNDDCALQSGKLRAVRRIRIQPRHNTFWCPFKDFFQQCGPIGLDLVR